MTGVSPAELLFGSKLREKLLRLSEDLVSNAECNVKNLDGEREKIQIYAN